jgi:hypothetical protein
MTELESIHNVATESENEAVAGQDPTTTTLNAIVEGDGVQTAATIDAGITADEELAGAVGGTSNIQNASDPTQLTGGNQDPFPPQTGFTEQSTPATGRARTQAEVDEARQLSHDLLSNLRHRHLSDETFKRAELFAKTLDEVEARKSGGTTRIQAATKPEPAKVTFGSTSALANLLQKGKSKEFTATTKEWLASGTIPMTTDRADAGKSVRAKTSGATTAGFHPLSDHLASAVARPITTGDKAGKPNVRSHQEDQFVKEKKMEQFLKDVRNERLERAKSSVNTGLKLFPPVNTPNGAAESSIAGDSGRTLSSIASADRPKCITTTANPMCFHQSSRGRALCPAWAKMLLFRQEQDEKERLELVVARENDGNVETVTETAAKAETNTVIQDPANTSHASGRTTDSSQAPGSRGNAGNERVVSEVVSCSELRNRIVEGGAKARKSSVTGKLLYKKTDDGKAIKGKLEKLRQRHLAMKISIGKVNESLVAFRSDPVKVTELNQEHARVLGLMQASAEDVASLSARLDILESQPKSEWNEQSLASDSDDSNGKSTKKKIRGSSMRFHPKLLPSYHDAPTNDPDHWEKAVRAVAEQFDLAGPGFVSMLKSKVPEKVLEDMGCYSDEGDTDLNPDAWLLKFRRACSKSDRTETYRRYFDHMVQKENQTHRVWLSSLRTVFRRAYPGEDPAYQPQALKRILTRFRLGMHPGPMRMMVNHVVQAFYINFERHLTRNPEVVFEELLRICKDSEEIAYSEYHDKGVPLTGRDPKLCKKCYSHTKGKPCVLDGLLEQGIAVTETVAAVEKARDSSDSSKERDEECKQVDWTKIQCYNCSEFGHFARACTKPKKSRDPEHVKPKPQQFANKYAKAEAKEPNLKGLSEVEEREKLYRERIEQLTEALKKSNMEVPEASAAGRAHLNF